VTGSWPSYGESYVPLLELCCLQVAKHHIDNEAANQTFGWMLPSLECRAVQGSCVVRKTGTTVAGMKRVNMFVLFRAPACICLCLRSALGGTLKG
jgi:hypothetical protein